ncbi:MAG: hypothetical protein MZU97_21690 [Bacillus subtilis]|nr:hypothetical protein [Bacillus subtilis]
MKFYLLMYLLLTLVIGGYTGYLIIQGTLEATDIWNALILPPFFVIIYYIFDVLMEKICSKTEESRPRRAISG